MNATRTRASFSATCARIESPDFTPKDRRTLTASDVVREDVPQDSPYARHITHNACQESFTDRRAFTDHMRDAHGVRMAPASQINVKRRAPKAPPVTAYDPRPLDAGAWVEWVQDGVTRTGQVWSESSTRHHLIVIPAECRTGETYVDMFRGDVKPLGHAVPVGLFGNEETPAEESARVKPSADRVFADAAAVKAHWSAGGDADSVPRMPVLALTACADMVVNGGLVAVKGTREWEILHAGSGKALHSAGYGPTTKRATVEAMRLLSLLPVPWGAATADSVKAVGAADAGKVIGTILSGVAVESDVLAVAARMAPVESPVVEESAPVVESPAQDETPDYGVTVDGVMVAKVRRVSLVEETPTVAPVVPVPVAAPTVPTAPPVVIVPPAPVEPPSVAPVTVAGPIVADAPATVLTVTGHAPEHLHCDRCARDHRKGTVTLSDGRHLGLACAAIVLGIEAATVKVWATEAQRVADATGKGRRRLSVA